jgi:hypothetical protein
MPVMRVPAQIRILSLKFVVVIAVILTVAYTFVVIFVARFSSMRHDKCRLPGFSDVDCECSESDHLRRILVLYPIFLVSATVVNSLATAEYEHGAAISFNVAPENIFPAPILRG